MKLSEIHDEDGSSYFEAKGGGFFQADAIKKILVSSDLRKFVWQLPLIISAWVTEVY